jgi:type II pantothenate kinase
MSADAPQAENLPPDEPQDAAPGSTNPAKHARVRTNTAEIDSTIIHPGSVKINVKGAFIVDQDSHSPSEGVLAATANGGSHDTKDIRLPNHTAVVSHIAVDVSISASNFALSLWRFRP